MPSAIQEDEPTKSVVKNESPFAKSNLKGDWLNIFILFLLYIMQGLPLGIVNVIPILLQSKRNVTYNEQTLFSLTGWPFSLKLLWAPLVDALYIHKIGRRKSWLIPVQFSIGICFFYLADNINDLLLEAEKPNVLKLTSVFLISTFLVATQDIVVDGWALTLLQKNNVGYASTCAFVGQFTGIIISSMSLILLTSEDFSNKYLKISLDVGGIVTVKITQTIPDVQQSDLFLICGVLFMVITTSIAIFKNEKDTRLEDDHIKLNTFQNYKLLWDISNLPCIKILAIAMLTSFIGFAPNDSVVPLKLIDAGVPKGNIMVIQTGINVLKIIIMPVIAVKYTAGPKPMNLYLNVIPTRLLWNFTFVILIYYTPELIKNNGVVDIPMYYYVIFVFIQSINDILHNMMTTALVAFYCRISDARFGGTYITLLHGFSNIGGAFAKFIAYGLIDLLTFKECSFDSNNNCSTSHLQNVCKSKGGDCITIVNGYYVESIVCTVFEIIWFIIFKNKLKQLQSKSPSHWLVKMNTLKSKNHESSYTLKDVKT